MFLTEHHHILMSVLYVLVIRSYIFSTFSFVFTFYLNPVLLLLFFFFFFNDTATPEISPLPLHDALPICPTRPASSAPPPRCRWARRSSCRPPSAPAISRSGRSCGRCTPTSRWRSCNRPRSEEHTSELQSRSDLVCRLLLEKKKKRKHEDD